MGFGEVRGSSLFVWVALFLSLAASGTDYRDRGYGGTSKPAALHVDQVVNALYDNPIFTIPDTLHWISQSTHGFFENFTLMRASRSLQFATPTQPRTIAFGGDAKFILTFNGHHAVGSDRLEMMQFLDATDEAPAQFVLREIVYTTDDFGDVSPVVSEPNPAKCLRCHHMPIRPIWDPYDIWEGAYGKRDDSMVDFDHDKYAPYSESGIVEEARRDLVDFTAFRAGVAGDPRYGVLEFSKDSPVAPYATSIRAFDYRFRPNLRLTGAITQLQAEAIASRLTRKNACYDHYKEVLMAQLLPCGYLDEKIGKGKFGAIRDGALRARNVRFPWRAGEEFKASSYRDPVHEIWPFLSLTGIDMEQWHMSFEPKDWSYFEGTFYLSDLVGQRLYKDLAKGDDELPDLSIPNGYQVSLDYDGSRDRRDDESFVNVCDTLAARIRTKFEISVEAPAECTSRPEIEAVPPTVKLCLSCHDGGTPNAPRLRFDEKRVKKIIEKRIESNDPKWRMPPDRSLSDREREELSIFLIRP